MHKTTRVLAIVLALQLAIAAVLWQRDSNVDTVESEPLLVFDIDAVDEVLIKGSEGEVLVRKSGDDAWSLPNTQDVTADHIKMAHTLKTFSEVMTGWPVATTKSAAARFEVAEDNAVRTVDLRGGGKSLATLYVGSSPSRKKLHMRAGGSNSVYVIEMPLYKVSAQTEDWFHKLLLKLNDVRHVSSDQLELTLSDQQWLVEPIPAVVASGERDIDQPAIAKWIALTAKVRAIDVATEQQKALMLDQAPVRSFTLSASEGSVTFDLYEHDGKSYIKSSRVAQLLQVPAHVFNDINNVSAEGFLAAVEQARPDEDTAPVDAEEPSDLPLTEQ